MFNYKRRFIVFFAKIKETNTIKRDIKITILKSEVDQKLADQYAISGFEACLFHKTGQFFVSDGSHKPEGLCEYAWKPIKDDKMLSKENFFSQEVHGW